MIAEPLTFNPLGSKLLVRMPQAAAATASGLHLPETAQQRPSEGTVLAAGPGRAIAGSPVRTVIWPQAGDRIVFARADFEDCGADGEGLVQAEDVIGIVDPETEEVRPENDWIAIDRDRAETESAGGILLPEISRKRAKHGVVRDFGPGRTILKGPWFGVRRDIRAIIGLKSDEPLIGRTVYWEPSAKVVHVGGKHPCTFVRASDLMLIEGD